MDEISRANSFWNNMLPAGSSINFHSVSKDHYVSMIKMNWLTSNTCSCCCLSSCVYASAARKSKTERGNSWDECVWDDKQYSKESCLDGPTNTSETKGASIGGHMMNLFIPATGLEDEGTKVYKRLHLRGTSGVLCLNMWINFFVVPSLWITSFLVPAPSPDL